MNTLGQQVEQVRLVNKEVSVHQPRTDNTDQVRTRLVFPKCVYCSVKFGLVRSSQYFTGSISPESVSQLGPDSCLCSIRDRSVYRASDKIIKTLVSNINDSLLQWKSLQCLLFVDNSGKHFCHCFSLSLPPYPPTLSLFPFPIPPPSLYLFFSLSLSFFYFPTHHLLSVWLWWPQRKFFSSWSGVLTSCRRSWKRPRCWLWKEGFSFEHKMHRTHPR